MTTQNIKPYSGSVATFAALLSTRKTLPQFKYEKTPTFHRKANLFAALLIRLWTKKSKTEYDTFFPNYQSELTNGNLQLIDLTISQQSVTFYKSSARAMRKYFLKGQAQQLGALTFLNLLMSSSFDNESLGIVKSPVTNNQFFKQRYSHFWLDYFENSDEYNHFKSKQVFQQKLKGFTLHDKHQAWWDRAFAIDPPHSSQTNKINKRKLFINELFDTAFRIFLTPETMLEAIAHKVLGKNQLTQDFLTYFFNKIRRFKNEFTSFLSEDELLHWSVYIQNHGVNNLNNYLLSLSKFHVEGTHIFNVYKGDIYEFVTIEAMNLNIPNLLPLCNMNVMDDFIPENQAKSFIYFTRQLILYWPFVSIQPHHELWDILEKLSVALCGITLNRIETLVPITSIYSVLIKSMQFKKTNIVSFLESQIDMLDFIDHVQLLLSNQPPLIHSHESSPHESTDSDTSPESSPTEVAKTMTCFDKVNHNLNNPVQGIKKPIAIKPTEQKHLLFFNKGHSETSQIEASMDKARSNSF